MALSPTPWSLWRRGNDDVFDEDGDVFDGDEDDNDDLSNSVVLMAFW